jgi:hypothetical protein
VIRIVAAAFLLAAFPGAALAGPIDTFHLAPNDHGRRVVFELAGLSTAADTLEGGRLQARGGSLVLTYHHSMGATVLSVSAGVQAWEETSGDAAFRIDSRGRTATNLVLGAARWLGTGPVRASLRGDVVVPIAGGERDTIHHIRALDFERFSPDWPGLVVAAGVRADHELGFVQVEAGVGAWADASREGVFPAGDLRVAAAGGLELGGGVHLIGELGVVAFAIPGPRKSASVGLGARLGRGDLSLRWETRLGACLVAGEFDFGVGAADHCEVVAARYALRF